MSLISVANLGLSLGDRRLFDGANLTLEPGEKIGMVGRNGCGKSTLLKLIAGAIDLQPDSGQVQVARDASVGYLRQDPDLNPDHTLREEALAAFAHLQQLQNQLETLAHDMATAEGDALQKLLDAYERTEHQLQAAGGFVVDHQVEATLHGVGLTDEFFDVRVGDLSGGQKGRLALAKLLLSQPTVLLLDEPTNHLDIAGRQWLEGFLAQFHGAALIVSHDRWLLDHVVSRICEMHEGRIEEYPGNYHQFLELRALRRLEQQRVYDKQQDRIKSEQAFIDRYRAGQRARQAQGRLKRLERFVRDETIDRPMELDELRLSISPSKRAGDLVIVAEHISKAYPDKPLFKDVSLVLKRGDRLGVIGPNGAGKSTLIRCLLGQQEIDHGKLRVGASVDVGFYRQSHDHLNMSHTVVDYLRQFVMGGTMVPGSEQAARDLAGAFMFSGESQDKQLGSLSGGERSRAVLAGLVVCGHNLLVLDEPTNHLDISSAERLEQALRKFTAVQEGFAQNQPGGGTLVLITHDRMLLEHLVNQLLVFDGKGNVRHFLGTYSEYLAAEQSALSQAQAAATTHTTKAPPKPKVEKESRKESDETKGSSPSSTDADHKNKRSRFGHLSQQKLEQMIIEHEQELAQIDQTLADPETYRDAQKVKRLQAQREKVKAGLTPLEEEWAERAQ